MLKLGWGRQPALWFVPLESDVADRLGRMTGTRPAELHGGTMEHYRLVMDAAPSAGAGR